MTLVFATHNAHKVAEVQRMMPAGYKVVSLREIGFDQEIEEPWFTLEENAVEKARLVHEMTGKTCFAEDSGLLVDYLHGKPGVLSKRYAGDNATDEQNNQKLLQEMSGIRNREAHFQTVIAFYPGENFQLFTGVCHGLLTENPRGHSGFGYDPLFIPEGSERTFGEMDAAEKAKYSHRGKAVSEFLQFLATYQPPFYGQNTD